MRLVCSSGSGTGRPSEASSSRFGPCPPSLDGGPADPHAGSCDQAAVDAARPQPPLQGAFLLLGGQDCNDGLVEDRLQALLGQSGTFHIATGTDLIRGKSRRTLTLTVIVPEAESKGGASTNLLR